MVSKSEITFILPTRNRKNYVCRAIESCLNCETDLIQPRILIIDGKSTDGSFEMLKERYGADSRVEIVQMDPIGFQRTAYAGAKLVSTEYVTYMYDDDILSPSYSNLISRMVSSGRDFVMGYGDIFPVDKVYPFEKNIRLLESPIEEVLLSYFGFHLAEISAAPPVSPICCVVRTKFLKEWVDFSTAFAEKSVFRKYFMIDQNIGPDEIIFLANILAQPGNVLVVPQIVAQFSAHDDSMSIQYGDHHLAIGYWIAKIWAVEKLIESRQLKLAAKCSGFLYLHGVKLLWVSLKRGLWKWIPSFCKELVGLFKHALVNRYFLASLASMCSSLYRRLRN